MYTHTCTHAHMHARIHAYTHIHNYAYTHARTYVCTYMYICMHIHIVIHQGRRNQGGRGAAAPLGFWILGLSETKPFLICGVAVVSHPQVSTAHPAKNVFLRPCTYTHNITMSWYNYLLLVVNTCTQSLLQVF